MTVTVASMTSHIASLRDNAQAELDELAEVQSDAPTDKREEKINELQNKLDHIQTILDSLEAIEP